MRHLLAILLLALCGAVHAAPSGFTQCAPEGEACDLRGIDAYVTFGTGSGTCDTAASTCTGSYTPLIRTGGGEFYVVCRLDLFSGVDPAPGQAKACYYAAASSTPNDPGAQQFDPNSVPHLLQAVLVMGHVFILWMGYRAGDKI